MSRCQTRIRTCFLLASVPPSQIIFPFLSFQLLLTLAINFTKKNHRITMGVQRDLSLLDCASSVSSTVTVERTEPKTTTSSKAVSFDDIANVYHENRMLCSEDCAELWYTAADYKMFKRNTMGMAKTILQFESQNKAPFSYQRVLEHSFTICKSAVSEHEPFQLLSSPSERSHLQRWITAAPNRVGMEHGSPPHPTASEWNGGPLAR